MTQEKIPIKWYNQSVQSEYYYPCHAEPGYTLPLQTV